MSSFVFRVWMSLGLMVILQVSLAEDVLDPSIFDGTGRVQREASPETEAAAPSSPAEDGETRGEEEVVPPGDEAGMGEEGGGPEEVVLPEEEPGTVGGEDAEADEEIAEDAPSSGGPAAVMTESRAGERVESSEKIAPGQAVDFPWDM